MGWRVSKQAQGFILFREEADHHLIHFENEADSHAAGEAVRLYLGRPRVSELIAQKEALERELAVVKAELGDRRKAEQQKPPDDDKRLLQALQNQVLSLHKDVRAAVAERDEVAREKEAAVRALPQVLKP